MGSEMFHLSVATYFFHTFTLQLLDETYHLA